MDLSPAKRSTVGLIAWCCLVAMFAAAGAFASLDAPTFYGALSRPSWAPPPAIFGPVWTLLYALMAIAAWRVWRDAGFANAGAALTIFIVQLVLNGAWSWLFFSLQKGLWAMADIVALWCAIALTLLLFARRDRPAALMLVPYLAWVTFAACLNYSVWQRNPALLS